MSRPRLFKLSLVLLLPLALLSLAFTQSPAPAAEPAPAPRPLPTLRQQAAEQQMWLEKRLTTVLPGIMRQHGIDL
ncbi:MAG TPA: hypothetical protein VLE27_12030, partial [Thermoanaerobaculia bacterium]|nr:hypothetical protein [Thermoanaerobaculia bacterium]